MLPLQNSSYLIDQNFLKLSLEYEKQIKDLLKEERWAALAPEKNLFHLFFDGINNKKGISSSSKLQFMEKKFQYSSSSVATFEILSSLINLYQLGMFTDPFSIQIIRGFISQLQLSLRFAFIFDGIRSKNLQIKNYVFGGDLTLQEAQNLEPALQSVLNDEEINSMVQKILIDLKFLKRNTYYQFLAGTVLHDSRILINKNSNNKYTLLHCDTAKTGAKFLLGISSISESILLEKRFWKRIILTKLTKTNPKEMFTILKELGPYNYTIPALALRSTQIFQICTYQSILSLMKFQFVTADLEAASGVGRYKYCKSLIKHYAIVKWNAKKTQLNDESLIYRYAKNFERASRRYILWEKEVQEGNFEKVKNAFLKTIAYCKDEELPLTTIPCSHQSVFENDENDSLRDAKSSSSQSDIQRILELHCQLTQILEEQDLDQKEVIEIMHYIKSLPFMHCVLPTLVKYGFKTRL